MTGFEPGSSGIGTDSSANCATTTSQNNVNVNLVQNACVNFPQGSVYCSRLTTAYLVKSSFYDQFKFT